MTAETKGAPDEGRPQPHQARERAKPCTACRRPTRNIDLRCDSCGSQTGPGVYEWELDQ